MTIITTSTVIQSQYNRVAQSLTSGIPASSKSFTVEQISTGTIPVPNTVAVGDIIPIVSLPIDGTLGNIFLANDDLGTTVTAQLGLYSVKEGPPTTSNGLITRTLSPISAGATNAFANAIALGTAVGFTNYRYTTKAHTTVADFVWSLAGYSARPTAMSPGPAEFMLALTITAVTAPAAGTVSFDIRWRA